MDNKTVDAVALSVRSLSMDGVEKASSGHPGLPMGLAELGSLVYGEFMNHYPGDWQWPNRDRFVLSAGHGSMLLYALLHLSGYPLTVDDLRKFRQAGSKTPGHPEYGHTIGVETTTGPLGQGVSNAVGMAIAEAHLAATYNTPEHKIVDHFVYAIASDGDLMEGVSAEACSLAGHLGLGKVIVFYDDNKISIEGSTDLAFTEDPVKRFEAYGWQTMRGDAYDVDGIKRMVAEAKKDLDRPTFIALSSVIGKGSPNKAGTHGVHGAKLGSEEIKKTRVNLGLAEDDEFFVHPDAKAFFDQKQGAQKKAYEEWKALFDAWSRANPELRKQWDAAFDNGLPFLKNIEMPAYKVGDSTATRKASGAALHAVAKALPNLIGGSADLGSSNNTEIPEFGDFAKATPEGRTLHFGVREHGMGAIANGIYLHGGLRPFCATFLVFTDYMRGSMRLAALMGLPVVYVMTHDSVFLGEDGPTHQPVEHYAALRAIPNMTFLRPGDPEETNEAWLMALERTQGPSVLSLTRQNLPVYEKADSDWKKSIRRGAYVVRQGGDSPKITIVATGSEVSLALEAADKARESNIRVVSMISRERFLEQDEAFREKVIPSSSRVVVAEIGVSLGWERFATSPKDIFCLERFGASAPAEDVVAELGYTAENLTKLLDA
jgi:transketolase